MPKVELDERVFKVAQRPTAEAGDAGVAKNVADVAARDTDDEVDNFDRFFTPEVIAQLVRPATTN